MKDDIFKSKILPHVIVLVVFYLVTSIFFSPLVFNKKILRQGDIQQGQGMSRQLKEYREANPDDNPMWNKSAFGGFPAFISGSKYPGDSFKGHIFRFFGGFMKSPANILFLTMICAYILMCSFGAHPVVGGLVAIAYGLTSFNVISIEAGHNAKIRAVAMIPIMFAGANYLFRKKLLLGITASLGGFTWIIATGHYQIAYYAAIGLGIYLLGHFIQAIKEKQLKQISIATAILVACGILGVLANLGRIWSVQKYNEYSIRGKYILTPPEGRAASGLDKGYAFEYQNGIEETMTLLVPHFEGGGSATRHPDLMDYESVKAIGSNPILRNKVNPGYLPGTLYWGGQRGTNGPIYIGAIICFLFILALFVLDLKYSIWLGLSMLFFLAISWGTNLEGFSNFMFESFPMYNKFRAVSMALVMVIFVGVVGAGLALHKIVDSAKVKMLDKKLYIAAGITGILCLLVALTPGTFDPVKPAEFTVLQQKFFAQEIAAKKWTPDHDAAISQLMGALKTDRMNMMSADGWRSFAFVALAFVMIFFYTRKIIPKYQYMTGAIALLIVVDLWVVDRRYFDDLNYEDDLGITESSLSQFIHPDQYDQQILQDKDLYYRVMDFRKGPYNNAATSYFHNSLGGYSPAKLRRIQDIYEYYIDPVMRGRPGKAYEGFNNYLRMMNCKYLITGGGVNKLPDVLGNAWFVQRIVDAANPDAEIDSISSFKPASEAIMLSSEFKYDASKTFKTEGATAKLTSHTNNKISFSTQNPNKGFMAISEVYFPYGWTATVDGKETPIYRINYMMRGIEVPAGNHKVEMVFAPASYVTGGLVGKISTLVVVLIMLGAVGLDIKKSFFSNNSDTPAETEEKEEATAEEEDEE